MNLLDIWFDPQLVYIVEVVIVCRIPKSSCEKVPTSNRSSSGLLLCGLPLRTSGGVCKKLTTPGVPRTALQVLRQGGWASAAELRAKSVAISGEKKYTYKKIEVCSY